MLDEMWRVGGGMADSRRFPVVGVIAKPYCLKERRMRGERVSLFGYASLTWMVGKHTGQSMISKYNFKRKTISINLL